MDTIRIRQSCFNLAESLMWEKDALTTEKVVENLKEFTEMTEQLFQIVMENSYMVEKSKDGEETLVQTVNYIERAFAIPPLRGNYAWFDHTLSTLLELCYPNSTLTEKHLPFLDKIQKGIEYYRNNLGEEWR